MGKEVFVDEDLKLLLAKAFEAPRDRNNALLISKTALASDLFFKE